MHKIPVQYIAVELYNVQSNGASAIYIVSNVKK